MESITSNEIISQHQRVHSMPVGNIFNHNELERSSNISCHDQNLLFGLTQVQLPIYQQDQNSLCHIELKCKVDRGFFLCERHWTCYRRNYFQITTAFTTTNCTNNQLFYLKPPSSSSSSTPPHCEQIHRFYVQVIATSSDGNRNVELIQLTAKRDKGPQRNPPMVLIHPGDGELVHHPHDTSQKTITFERLQFKSATANNGKKRASQQYYYLSIQLIAECNNSKYVIASCQSCPLVVRGRSPGHYADTLNHKHTPYLKSSSLNNNNSNNTNNKKKKQQQQQQQQKEEEEREMEKEKEQQVSSLSIPSPSPLSIETKENEFVSTVATPTIPQQQDHYTSIPSTPIITTPTIPSNHSSVFYTSSPHVRSFSANDTTWHLSSNRHHPLPSYRTTTPWDHFQMLSSSPSSTSSPHTQQQEHFAWSNDLQQQNNHQRTQSTTASFNTYNTTTSSTTPSEHSSSAFQRYDFQPLSSPILLPTQQQQQQQQQQQPSISSSSSSSSSSTSSTSSSSSTSLISQATNPNTTYILYPNAPHWDAFKHKTIAASYQTNDIKQ